MEKFSVLLLYPDYYAASFGQETYYAFVEAESPDRAIALAQQQCFNGRTEAIDNLEDLYPLLVTKGYNLDVQRGN